MRFIIKMVKGILIGISVVIPGVSGGSMAVSMGIYDQLIELVTVSRGSRKRFSALLPYMLGITIGVAVFAYLIELLFAFFPLQTAFVFVGMIVGALPMLTKKVKGERFRASHFMILAGTTFVMILLPVASRASGFASTLQQTWAHAGLVFVLGFIAAVTMVVPGVSGSMLLMLLGYYAPLLQYVNAFTLALLRLDLVAMFSCAKILLPFGIGVLFGIVAIARVIKSMLQRYPCATYYGIIGLVMASPFAVLYQQSFAGTTFLNGVVCAALLLAGFGIALLLGKGEKEERANI